jgi:hypothetical protein
MGKRSYGRWPPVLTAGYSTIANPRGKAEALEAEQL